MLVGEYAQDKLGKNNLNNFIVEPLKLDRHNYCF